MSSARPIPLFRTSLLASEPVDRARVLDTLVNNLDGMAYRCHLDRDWTMVFVSQGCLALTGHAADALVGSGGLSWEEITHPNDRVRVRREIEAAVRGARRFAVEYRILSCDGKTKWVFERGIPVADECGQTVIEGFVEDITERRATVAALEHAELRYRHIFEHASEGIFQTTPDGRYLAANPALASLYGYATPDALIADLSDLDRRLYVEPGRRDVFRRLMETHGEVRNFESEVYRRDGARIWISENAHIVRGRDGRLICYEGTVQDITERRSYEAQLERQANHDQLTGLPNRNLLRDRIEQGVARAARRGCMLALVFIDLDGFKFINDSLGHAAGDELLIEIAGRLNASIRSSDTVGRLGGDEFVLVLNDHEQLGSVISTLERVLKDIGRPVAIAGRELQVGASLGVAMYPNDGDNADSLLKHADVAMYAAKSRGRNNFQFFTRALNCVAEERLTLEAAMRVAIERDEFEVHYQPKLDHRRRIVGMEALARWRHPELGDIRPDRFIPIAEESGLILPLTTCILRRAFAAARAWNCDRDTPLRLAVNLSPRLFLSQDIVTHVAALLREAGLPASQVELEVTETVFLGDDELAVSIFRGFKALGLSLAMDDFGTGYSSLGYLSRFPLDIIKIDRSLVVGIEHREETAMIARAVISLSQSLRKTVVAEGVENPAQFDFLRFQGCDEFQGYLFSRPLPEAEFARLLAQGGSIPARTD